MDDFNSNINARVSVVESTVSKHDERIEDLEDWNNKITRIDTLMGMLLESNKEQTETLKGINKNLNNLNKGYENLDKRMEILEDNQKEIKERSTINTNEMVKRFFVYGLPSFLVSMLVFYLAYTFGWK